MNKNIWRICLSAVIIIAILSYFFVFATGKAEPELLGTPYAFWMGILLTTVLVLLTFIAQKFFPFKEDTEA